MTHPHPLHVAVLAQCLCCRSLQPFTFTSATDQVVCTSCRNHLGPEKAQRRDTEHGDLWVRQFAEQQDKHRRFAEKATATLAGNDARIAALAAQVEDLRALVAGRADRAPGSAVRALVETDLIRRAERRTVLAHRRIDWAMAAIWRVRMLHHDDVTKPGFCVCGRRTVGCADGRAIDPQRQSVSEWEERNLRLLRDGSRHGLPEDHPDVP